MVCMAPAFATHPMCRTSWGTSSLWDSDLSGKKFENDFINFCFWLSIGRNVTKLMEIFHFKDVTNDNSRELFRCFRYPGSVCSYMAYFL